MSRRVDLTTAAALLGLSEAAVRKRLQRGTLPGGKGPDGRWYAVLDSLDGRDPASSHRGDTRDDGGVTAGVPPVDRPSAPDQAPLVEQLRSEVDHLRTVLARRDDELARALEHLAEERRRADTLMALIASRPKELAPPTASPDAPGERMPPTPPEPESPPPAPSSGPQAGLEGAGERPAPRRPWWRRWW